MHLELNRAVITPAQVYSRLNRLLWLNRLPVAKIVLVEDSVIPKCKGITFHDNLVVNPVILLNVSSKRWAKTLVHEMMHVAEPQLMHGTLFDILVDLYWRIAKNKIKGLDTL